MMMGSPWLMLPSAASEAYMMYSLAEQKVVRLKKEAAAAEVKLELVGSSHGWLASYNSDTHQSFLSDPITARHIKLPNIRTLPATTIDPTNIILTSSPDAPDSRAVMIFGPHNRMAVCSPGRSASWLPVGDHQADYEHLVYSTAHKRLFCITWRGDAECWDLHALPSPSIVWKDRLIEPDADSEEEEQDPRCFDLTYLVTDDHSGRLFAVMRHVLKRVGRDGSYVKPILHLESHHGSYDHFYPYKTRGFDVYEIDYKGGGKCTYMDASLDGLAMFIGNNHSFALPGSPEYLTPNSIYFTDHTEWHESCLDHHSLYGGHDIGIFNYVDRTFSSLYYPSHVSQITNIGPAPAFWFTPTH